LYFHGLQNSHEFFAASEVTYSIESGNPDDTFVIEKNTGKIRVNKNLDYETTTSVRQGYYYIL